MSRGPLPPKTLAGTWAETQRVRAAGPLLPAPLVPRENVHCRGLGAWPDWGHAGGPRPSAQGWGQPQGEICLSETPVGRPVQRGRQGPHPSPSHQGVKCVACLGVPGFPQRPHPPGGVLFVWRASRPHPLPQCPHLESHMLVPSSGLPEPERAHTEGDGSLWLDCISRRIRGFLRPPVWAGGWQRLCH